MNKFEKNLLLLIIIFSVMVVINQVVVAQNVSSEDVNVSAGNYNDVNSDFSVFVSPKGDCKHKIDDDGNATCSGHCLKRGPDGNPAGGTCRWEEDDDDDGDASCLCGPYVLPPNPAGYY